MLKFLVVLPRRPRATANNLPNRPLITLTTMAVLTCHAKVQTLLPPVFLAPSLFSNAISRATAPFSTSAAPQRLARRRDNNPNRGVSALRRTGLKRRVEMSYQPLPKPVMDPERRSKVTVDPDHGLWGFFRADKKAIATPEEADAFGPFYIH